MSKRDFPKFGLNYCVPDLKNPSFSDEDLRDWGSATHKHVIAQQSGAQVENPSNQVQAMSYRLTTWPQLTGSVGVQAPTVSNSLNQTQGTGLLPHPVIRV